MIDPRRMKEREKNECIPYRRRAQIMFDPSWEGAEAEGKSEELVLLFDLHLCGGCGVVSSGEAEMSESRCASVSGRSKTLAEFR